VSAVNPLVPLAIENRVPGSFRIFHRRSASPAASASST
jgi:hypothetical protein